MMALLSIVGIGVGHPELWTEKAKQIIESGNRILSTSDSVFIDGISKNARYCSLKELERELAEKIEDHTVVLVRGDCNFYSISQTLFRRFQDRYEIQFFNGISSVQYLSGKIGVAYDDAHICSMHGRDAGIVGKVAYHPKVFALTGGEYKAHLICETLDNHGLGAVRVWVGEKLSYPEERILSGMASDLKKEHFDDLSVMYIENSEAVCPYVPLKDEEFIRGEIPMTKEEVRWLSVQKLEILPGDIVFDIGAGTGSVAIEMARKAFDGWVYGIEQKKEACELIRANQAKHKAYNLTVIEAKAPEGLAELPIPDKVFIGGSAGNFSDILHEIRRKNPLIRMVASAITLQSLEEIRRSYENAGFFKIEIICVNVAKSKKIKNYDMMLAQNPVYIVTGSGE